MRASGKKADPQTRSFMQSSRLFSYMPRRLIAFDDSEAWVRSGKSLNLPNGSLGRCSVEIWAHLVIPRVEASWWSSLVPIHPSELVSVVSPPSIFSLLSPRPSVFFFWLGQTNVNNRHPLVHLPPLAWQSSSATHRSSRPPVLCNYHGCSRSLPSCSDSRHNPPS